jgi:hypothetical protein
VKWDQLCSLYQMSGDDDVSEKQHQFYCLWFYPTGEKYWLSQTLHTCVSLLYTCILLTPLNKHIHILYTGKQEVWLNKIKVVTPSAIMSIYIFTFCTDFAHFVNVFHLYIFVHLYCYWIVANCSCEQNMNIFYELTLGTELFFIDCCWEQNDFKY